MEEERKGMKNVQISREWTQQCGCGDEKGRKDRRIKRMFVTSGLFWAVQGSGGMTVHACVPTYSATWHSSSFL